MKALAFSGGKDSMACLHLLRDSLACAIYVDTGYAYPETQRMVEYAAKLVPMHVVHSARRDQNELRGLPSDVVPVDWTTDGQACTTAKEVTLQPYLQCCFENIAAPLFLRARELGVTELVYGQRNDEGHRSTSKDGDVLGGIVRRQPIADWTKEQVLDYLGTKMSVPEHYNLNHSSLDCYDCTAYRAQSWDRVEWTRKRYPVFFQKYRDRADRVEQAVREAFPCL